MIYTPGPVTLSFEHRLDQLDARSVGETTLDGFEYGVVDRSLLEIPNGLVGTSKVTTDTIEMRLILGSDIPKNVRPVLADICIAAAVLGSEGRISIEGLLCEATRQTLNNVESDLRSDTFGTIQSILNSYRAAYVMLDQARRYREVTPEMRAQLKHCLGMTATMRSMAPAGIEMIDSLTARDLYVPVAESGQVLHGKFRTPRDGSVEASVYFAPERGNKHCCKTCNGQIFRGDMRITLSMDRKVDSYDHHHYHPVCFAETDLALLDLNSAKPKPLPPNIASHFMSRKH